MASRMGERKDLDIEITSRPRDEYQTEAYLKTGLPKAPAIMVRDEIVVQGRDMAEEELDAVISGKRTKAAAG